MSGSASQFSGVSCQLSDGSVTTSAAGRLPGGAQNDATRAGDSTFGNVLSAKMSGPVADSQGSLSPARRANAPADTSSKNPGATKLGDEKRTEDHTPAATAVAVQVLPAQSFVPTVQEAPHPSLESLGGAPNLDGASALNAAAPPPPISLVPASRAPGLEAIGSAPTIGAKDTAPVADPLDATSGLASDQSPSATDLLANVISVAPDGQAGPVVGGETASLGGVTPKVTSPGTLMHDATRSLKNSSARNASPESGSGADTSSGSSAPGNDAVSAAEVLGKLRETPTQAKEAWVEYPGGNTLQDNNAGFERNPETASQVGALPTSVKGARPLPYAQPLNPITSTQPETPAPQFNIGDSLASKTTDLTQPVHPITTRDEQQNADTSSSVVLPVAGHAAAGPASREDRSQATPDAAPSSPAENAQTAPTVIQSAQVLERMGKSEIRLGLNSSNFGNIELHTSVNQDRVGASISTSHAELRTAMIAEMPSLEHAIAQHQMRLDSFQFDSRSGPQAGDSSASGGNPSGSRSGTQATARISESSEDTAAQEALLPQAWTASHSGINVHA